MKPEDIKILVACEESQRVCIAFRQRRFTAFSCDIQDCSGGHPEWHIKDDVLNHIKDGWDLIIAHPPCTDLACSGARWFSQKRADGRQAKSIAFFMAFTQVCTRYAIENPVGIMSGVFRKPDQIIEPYYFGDAIEKKTCLWLSGIPFLQPTEIVRPLERVKYASGRSMPKWYADAWSLPPEERAKVRSKTFPGIAKAMAEQWGDYLLEVL